MLDDFTSKTSRESMKNTIAGPGNNRFPDKSFSMIIGQDSSASFTFEHGWGDGKAIDTIGNQVFNYLKALEDNKEKFLHIFKIGCFKNSKFIIRLKRNKTLKDPIGY